MKDQQKVKTKMEYVFIATRPNSEIGTFIRRNTRLEAEEEQVILKNRGYKVSSLARRRKK